MLTRKEYNDQVDQWKNQHKNVIAEPEQVGFKDDEWECEYCKEVNTMDIKKRESAFCKKCTKKNENIFLMIKMSLSAKHLEEEEGMIGAYNKMKNEPIKSASKTEEAYQPTYVDNHRNEPTSTYMNYP